MYQLFVRYPKSTDRPEDRLDLHNTYPSLAAARKVARGIRAWYAKDITSCETFIRDVSQPLGQWVERKRS